MDPTTIVSQAKKTLRLISFSYIVIFALSSFPRLAKGSFGITDIASLLLGVYIIYSLYQAKTWAKNYIMFCCLFFAVLIIPSILGNLSTFVPSRLIIHVIFLSWALFIVWFLSKSEVYEKYQELVQKGYDFEANTTATVSEIIALNFLLPIQFTKIKSLADYKKLTKDIFSKFEMDHLIEEISTNEDEKILVETAENIFELEYDPTSIFFDQNYLQGVNFVLKQIRKDDKYLGIIYPATTLDKQQRSLALASPEEFWELKNRGFYE